MKYILRQNLPQFFLYFPSKIFLVVVPPQNGDLRLTNPEKKEGRLEIYYNGTWGTICDDSWDLKDATVACRQLGYPVAIRKSTRAEFGRGTGEIWLDNVECTGEEERLSNCEHGGWGVHNCGHSEDAGIVCNGKLFLVLQY